MNTMRKQSKENNCQNYNIIRLRPQRSSNKYGSIQVCNQSQPIRNDLKIFQSSANTNTIHTPCLMMEEISLKTSLKNILIQDMMNSGNSMNTTESTNTNTEENCTY